MRRHVVLIALAMFGLSITALAFSRQQAGTEMRVIHRWYLGGSDDWDYLAMGPNHRLFVTHGTQVNVVDTRSGALLGDIRGTIGVHGIALVAQSQRGYASDGGADSVTEFDVNTLAVIRKVTIPAHDPDGIVYDAATNRVFTFDGRSNDVSVLDANGLRVLKTLRVPGKPEFAVDDDAGHIYDNIENEAGEVVRIDSKTLTVDAVWPLAGCVKPTGLAIDHMHHRLFSVCNNRRMVVTNAVTGKQVARLPIGAGPDATRYDLGRHLVFSSNEDGTLTVIRQIDADHYKVVGNVRTQSGARTMELDPSNGDIYLSDVVPKTGAPESVPPESLMLLVVGYPKR